MGDGRTCVVLLWETRAMSEQNALVSAVALCASSSEQVHLTIFADMRGCTNTACGLGFLPMQRHVMICGWGRVPPADEVEARVIMLQTRRSGVR
jgi:hypothetical protein